MAVRDVIEAGGIDQMTDRELVAGLMRGQRSALKLGYTAENAVKAVAETRGIDPLSSEYARLAGFAEGFAEGMVEDYKETYPAVGA